MGSADERLVRDARQGKEQAFLRLFDEHYLPLFRFSWRITRSMADAEEIVQECFLTLLRPSCSFDPARAAVRTYLFGAVRNQSLNRLRRREQSTMPEQTEHRTPETTALENEMIEAVATAIAALPESQREVLLLAHYEQMPLAEIAEITESEVSAVKSRLQRARATLRESLAEYAPRKERAL